MLTVLYTPKVYFSFFNFFFMTKVLLHSHTAERDLDSVECECFLLRALLQCPSELFLGLHKVNKTFLGRFFFSHIVTILTAKPRWCSVLLNKINFPLVS